ncbi:hypothetical protein ACMX2I_10760 [Bacillus sp. SW14]|uniref:hypothetical protein n=1 Tax=Bacillus sp. SW14 TaxID=3391618 RepID=UPI0039E61682
MNKRNQYSITVDVNGGEYNQEFVILAESLSKVGRDKIIADGVTIQFNGQILELNSNKEDSKDYYKGQTLTVKEDCLNNFWKGGTVTVEDVDVHRGILIDGVVYLEKQVVDKYFSREEE